MFNLKLLPVLIGFVLSGFGALLFILEPLILTDLFRVTDFESAHLKIVITIILCGIIGSTSLGFWAYKNIFVDT